MPEAKKKTKNVINNWPEIKATYRTDKLSNRQIALQYDIAESTLRAKIKKDKWQKDLAKQVTTVVNDKVSRLVNNQVDTSADDEAVVEKVANEKVAVLTGHRESLNQVHDICKSLASELQAQLTRKKRVIEIKGKPLEVDVELDYVGKTLGQLSKSLKDVVELERKSYGLDDDSENDGSYDEQLVRLLGELEKAEKAEKDER